MSIDNYSELSANADYITFTGINIFGLSSVNEKYDTHYLVYKIVNINNGKYYIGQHKTTNPCDNYMGSGKYLERAIKKEGLSSFVKIILEDFNNFEDMNNKEKELVPVSCCFPENPNSYNLIEGGNGRLPIKTQRKITKKIKRLGLLKGKNNPMYGRKRTEAEKRHQSEVMTGRKHSEKFRQKCRKRCAGSGNPMFGKHHTEEVKQKLSKLRKTLGLSVGEKNPMYGLQCLTEQQKQEWKQKISAKNKGRTWTPERKQQQIEKYLQETRKKMYHPETNHRIFVPFAETNKYLALGYVFGIGKINRTNANAKSMVGKRKMINDKLHDVKIVNASDIEEYLKRGYHFSNRSLKTKISKKAKNLLDNQPQI